MKIAGFGGSQEARNTGRCDKDPNTVQVAIISSMSCKALAAEHSKD